MSLIIVRHDNLSDNILIISLELGIQDAMTMIAYNDTSVRLAIN